MLARIGVLLFGLLLAGCVLPKGTAPAGDIRPIMSETIAQTTLPSAAPALSAPAEKPKDPEAPAAAEAPVKPKQPDASAIAAPPSETPPEESPAGAPSPEELACLKAKGSWSIAGRSGAHTCIYSTKDGGKSCRRERDCEGVCLARSKTCSPVRPLFGCNDILQDDGAMATLCID